MKINKTLTLGMILTTMFISSTAISKIKTTQVDTSEMGTVLFRIENIKPIENKDNIIDKCSFVVTVYNRMDKSLKEANLELGWQDNISKKYAVLNGEVKANSDEDSVTIVNSDITLRDVAPHKQKSFEQVVDTDKCFLLLDNLTYKVKTCITDSEKIIMKDSKVVSRGDCLNNFNYIDSKNPEYYSEFKDVPDSVLRKQAEEEKLSELRKINELEADAVKNLSEANTALEQIK